MGKKKVSFDLPSSPPPTKIKKKNNDGSFDLERQKHINNLLETKKELENKIMAHTKKKKSAAPSAPPVLPPLAQEVVCCVPLCSNSSFSTKNKMFFAFPMTKKISKQWVQNVGRKGFEKKGAENLSKNYKVCSDHFEPQMFVPKTKHRVLLDNAIPTIFENAFEPEISIHTPSTSSSKKSGPKKSKSVKVKVEEEQLPLKTLPKRKSTKKKMILDDDFDYDDFDYGDEVEDIPLSTLLSPKVSMKKKLIKKTDTNNKTTKWMYKPVVQVVTDIDKDAVQSSGSEYEDDTDGSSVDGDTDKRKMGSRRKPKETLPLTMECWSDELSPAQKEAYGTRTKIYEECKKKLDELAKMKNAKLIFENREISAYEVDDGIIGGEQIEIEDETEEILAQENSRLTPASKKYGKTNGATDKTKTSLSPSSFVSQTASSIKVNRFSAIKPQESSSLGGLFSKVSKSNDSGSTPDSKEVSFNKLAGKTYPSLVVTARPSLRLKEIPQTVVTTERTALDAKVKAVLLYSNSNLTEWLIREGLLRSEQFCTTHSNPDGPVKLKLGMYSDVSKFPHSGGYVWISECCPTKFVSVFYNSIFEGAPHAPSILVKLMYHWACQTSIANVTSWVKIDNLYLKTFYSYMRCVCTAAVHEKHELIGGPMQKVEVGVISLGTTNVDGNLRQVKVEVLGVFETDTTKIRLRAIEPLPESERNQKKRFAKIMEPLKEWVHPESAICTDFTVDKSAFLALGFKNVYQVSLNDTNPPQMNNKNIMEYLRRVVPRMFQNTLSLLSRHIIQQFLDELVWRERFGSIPSRAFESVVKHLAEQTKLDTGDTLLNRFMRISINPFLNWQYSKWSQNAPAIYQDYRLGDNDYDKRGRKRPADESPVRPAKKSMSSSKSGIGINTPLTNSPDENISLEGFYYGTMPGKENHSPELNLKYDCPTCFQCFTSTNQFVVHLQVHAIMPDNHRDQNPTICLYCLKTFTSPSVLEEHIDEAHVKKSIHCKCLICQEKCREKSTLLKHMHRSHNQSELPYRCDYCEFRSSEHKQVVDHFYHEHSKDPVLQCPLCLKVVAIAEGDQILDKNITFYITHLQRHQKKTAKKCERCMLSFINKMSIREHQLRDHGSQKNEPGLEPYVSSSNIMIKLPPNAHNDIPVSRLRLQTISINYSFERFDHYVSFAPNIPDGLMCNECEVDLKANDHFPGLFNCSHCSYTTCCINAMHDHAKCFHESRKDPEYNISKPTILETRMYCVCGFNSNSGNKLARHTAMCKKISVYPNEESAMSARIVVEPGTTSVLNILGLVRRDGDPEDSSQDDTSTLLNGDDPKLNDGGDDEEDQLEEDDDNLSRDDNQSQISDEQEMDDDLGDDVNKEKNNDATDDITEEREKSNDATDDITEEREKSNDATDDITEEREKCNDATDDITEEEEKSNDATDDITEEEEKSNDVTDDITEEEEKSNDATDDITEEREKSNDVTDDITEEEQKDDDDGTKTSETSEISSMSSKDTEGSDESGENVKSSSIQPTDEETMNPDDEESAAFRTKTNESSDTKDETTTDGVEKVAEEDKDKVDDLSNDSQDISAEKEAELLGEDGDTQDDVPKMAENNIDDAISDSASMDNNVGTVDDDEESLLNSGDDSNSNTGTSTDADKPTESIEISEVSTDADPAAPEIEITPSAIIEPIDEDVPATTADEAVDPSTKTTTSGGGGGLVIEEDDDAELIKQDMAALQADLAALSGTCDIPLNTILDRQMEPRASSHSDTETPPKSVEKMDSQDQDSPMEVDENSAEGGGSSPSMDCESSNSADNMQVE